MTAVDLHPDRHSPDAALLVADCGHPGGGPWLELLLAATIAAQLLLGDAGDLNRRPKPRAPEQSWINPARSGRH